MNFQAPDSIKVTIYDAWNHNLRVRLKDSFHTGDTYIKHRSHLWMPFSPDVWNYSDEIQQPKNSFLEKKIRR